MRQELENAAAILDLVKIAAENMQLLQQYKTIVYLGPISPKTTERSLTNGKRRS